MALKDLIVDSGAVTEEVIEKIISVYVRYEVDPPAIVFTPEGNALDNVAKVIVYSAAIFGLKYVFDGPPVISTKPADLENALGISGPLRLVLKKLKDNHLLAIVEANTRSGHPTFPPRPELSAARSAWRLLGRNRRIRRWPVRA